MQKIILSLLFSLFSFAVHSDIQQELNEMRILSALGDALGRVKELNGATTSMNLQSPVSSLSDIAYPIYTDDTAMVVLTEQSLHELRDYLTEKKIDISLHFKNFDLQALHAFLQQKQELFLGSEIEQDILNTFGEIVARNYLKYFNYWTQPGRAPGIGCTSAIEGIGLQLLNQDKRPSVKKQISTNMDQLPWWWNCGAGKTDATATGGGNGAVMRTYPCAIYFYEHPIFATALSLIQSHVTHSASIGVLPTAIFTYGVAQALKAKNTGNKIWWSDIIQYLSDGAILVGLSNYKNKIMYYVQLGQQDRVEFVKSFDKKSSFAQLWDSHFDVSGVLQSNTWTGFGALHAALYMMSLCGESNNPAQALQWSAHIQGDTDSVGTLVATFLSLLYSIEELREKESQNSVSGVFEDRLLSLKNLALLEDYQYLCSGDIESILFKYAMQMHP